MPRTPPEVDAPPRRIPRRTWRDLPAAPPTAAELAAEAAAAPVVTEPEAPPVPAEDTEPHVVIEPAPVVEIAAPPAPRGIGARKAFVIVLVLVLLLGAGAAVATVVSDDDDGNGSFGPAAASGGSVEDVAAELSPSVVNIETGVGVGSGVVAGESLVLTAAHVVAGADEVTIKDESGGEYEGRVVARDAAADLAVVSVDDDGALPPATFATETVEVGQDVVAVGSPFGFQTSVTTGIVSGLDRTLESPMGTLTGLIQTDTAINPGNSGGALANMDAEVVGIPTAIASMSGSSSGVGFAIPIAVTQAILDEVIANGGADAPTVSDDGATGGSLEDMLGGGLDDLGQGLDDLLGGAEELDNLLNGEGDIDALLRELESMLGTDLDTLFEDLGADLGTELGPEFESLLDDLLGDTPGDVQVEGGILDLSGLPSDLTIVSSRVTSSDTDDGSVAADRYAMDSADGAVLLLAERSGNAADQFDDLDGGDVDLGGIDAKVIDDAGSDRYAWMIGDDVLVVLVVPEGTSVADVTDIANTVEVA
ncbi:MAG: trypsin-like peptidase domain-containing protein [Actinomycetota bacterium]|nr:trypsin-like peptidase domain-containing protein [Actinomycetota bacterium]